MITKFILRGKELFYVTVLVPVDVGDTLEYDKPCRDMKFGDDHVYGQYKIIGRTFRMTSGFGGELRIELKKV